MFSICEHRQCLSVNCYLRTDVMMALTIHVRVYCLDVVMSLFAFLVQCVLIYFLCSKLFLLPSRLSKNLFVYVTMHACALLSRCICASPVNSRVILLHPIDWPHSTSHVEHIVPRSQRIHTHKTKRKNIEGTKNIHRTCEPCRPLSVCC